MLRVSYPKSSFPIISGCNHIVCFITSLIQRKHTIRAVLKTTAIQFTLQHVLYYFSIPVLYYVSSNIDAPLSLVSKDLGAVEVTVLL